MQQLQKLATNIIFKRAQVIETKQNIKKQAFFNGPEYSSVKSAHFFIKVSLICFKKKKKTKILDNEKYSETLRQPLMTLQIQIQNE